MPSATVRHLMRACRDLSGDPPWPCSHHGIGQSGRECHQLSPAFAAYEKGLVWQTALALLSTLAAAEVEVNAPTLQLQCGTYCMRETRVAARIGPARRHDSCQEGN